MSPTVRKYPRTLAEAFNDADRASSGDWVRYDVQSAGHQMVVILSTAGLAGFVAWAILQVLM